MASKAIVTQGTVISIEDAGTPGTFIKIGEAYDLDGLGEAAPADIDVTSFDTTKRRETVAGLLDEQEITFAVIFDPADAGQTALRTAQASQAILDLKVEFADQASTTVVMPVQVRGFTLGAAGEDAWRGSVTVRAKGDQVWS